MAETILIIIVLAYLFYVYKKGEETKIQTKKSFNDALHPVFNQATVEQAQIELARARIKHQETFDTLYESEELKKDRPFQPSEELKNLMRSNLESELKLERANKIYNFLIEGNAAVSNGRDKVENIKSKYEKLLDDYIGLNLLTFDQKISEWEQRMTTKEDDESEFDVPKLSSNQIDDDNIVDLSDMELDEDREVSKK